MDLKQIEYILKIAEENNVTRASEKLFITQSALNQQLLKLEKELGAPLFFRTRNNWKLTEIGELYVRSAKEMLRMKENTYNQISDMVENKTRHFSLGLVAGRGIGMFTTIYPHFLKLFPDISISPIEMSSFEQQILIADKKLNLGFVTISNEQRINNEYLPIYSEEIYVAVPSQHPLSTSLPTDHKHPPEIDIRLLKDEPFVLMYQGSSCRAITDSIFNEAGITPKILFETSNAGSIPQFVSSGICCGLIPEYYSLNRPDITLFSLPSHPHWELAFCYSKQTYLSKPLKMFIDMSKDYWDTYYGMGLKN